MFANRTSALRQRSTRLPHRATGFLCLALLVLGSMLQAVHIHGSWLQDTHPKAALTHDAPSGSSEADCPLCAAAHVAIGQQTYAIREPLPLRLLPVRSGPQPIFAERLHYELFSRPPPTQI